MAKNYAYLVMVNGAGNNNKFYEATEQDDGSIDVVYGRVDKTSTKHHYEPGDKKFDTLINSKKSKGYEDCTSLHAKDVGSKPAKIAELSYKPVEDPIVQAVLDRVINASRMFIKKNYKVAGEDITQEMIDTAQQDLARLSRIASTLAPGALDDFNHALESLFMHIPRAMNNVRDFMAKSVDDFSDIISREAQMLDNLKGALKAIKPAPEITDDTDRSMTVLEARGLTMRRASYAEEDAIRAHLGKDYHGNVERRFIRAFAVENLETKERYENYKKERGITQDGVKFFYHGSKLENWYSIMSTGLMLNPDAVVTGKMFGQGLYFAPECRKALNYMDTRGAYWTSGGQETGYTAIFRVALGKPYEPDRILGSGFTKKDLPAGCDSVFASKKNPHLGLMNDEYIVFDQGACTIKYLMEISHQYVNDLSFSVDRKTLRNCFIGSGSSLTKEKDGTCRVKITVENLPEKARTWFISRFNSRWDGKALAVLDTKSGMLASFTDTEGRGDLVPSLTEDDRRFLMREIKKGFAEGEYEWEKLLAGLS